MDSNLRLAQRRAGIPDPFITIEYTEWDYAEIINLRKVIRIKYGESFNSNDFWVTLFTETNDEFNLDKRYNQQELDDFINKWKAVNA